MKGFKRTFKKILTFMMLILLIPQVTEILPVIDHVSSKINNFNSKTKEVQNDFETHKKIVCLTGSSGNMGFAGFKTLYAKKDQYSLVLLNLDNQSNRKKFAKYIHDSSVKLIWGDLTNYEDVLKCVNGSHYVLHVGGMVSPAADYYPNKTIHTNVMAAKNIVKAIKSQPDPLSIKVVYVGSVAQTGDRNEPLHWGRTGDPIKISIYDHYAISKTIAERIFAESGLKYWVSLRQSGILYPNLFKNIDPIIFHVPLNGVLEWTTLEDSGQILERVCQNNISEDFWRRFYNIGSGQEYRLTNLEFLKIMLEAVGFNSIEALFDPNWFSLRNFHGQWFTDSDVLENYLHFRNNIPINQYLKLLKKQIPKFYQLSRIVPKILIKQFVMKKLTKLPIYGTINWIENNNINRISAYFGSKENWLNIKDWNSFKIIRPSENQSFLNHGYNEEKPINEYDIEDMKKAAIFRGGECLSSKMIKGDLFTPLKWRSAFGNEFMMTPNLVLRGGHWCPQELPWPWNYDAEAKVNPFFAQVWYPLHDKNENNYYDERIFKGLDGF